MLGWAAGAGAAAAGQGADGILGQHPPRQCWCYGRGGCELVPGAQPPWELPNRDPWGRELHLQPLTSHLGSSSPQKRWAQRINFQGSGGSGWFSPKHYQDKDHHQIIPGHCTKARNTSTLVQIAFFGHYHVPHKEAWELLSSPTSALCEWVCETAKSPVHLECSLSAF